MKKDEVEKSLKLLGGLFPMKVSQEQMKLVADAIKEMTFDAASKAIRLHASSNEFFALPKLLEGCRACAFEHEKSRETCGREGSHADVIRRQAPYLAGTSDAEVILRKYRGDWFSPKCSQSDGYRNQFRSQCVNALFATNKLTLEQCQVWTETIFDPDPGYFQQVLDDLRKCA